MGAGEVWPALVEAAGSVVVCPAVDVGAGALLVVGVVLSDVGAGEVGASVGVVAAVVSDVGVEEGSAVDDADDASSVLDEVGSAAAEPVTRSGLIEMVSSCLFTSWPRW